MKIIKKVYYRIELKLASAMAIGSGENTYSDQDLIRDSAGRPFIPGSALAGLYRSSLNEADAIRYFGDELVKGKIIQAGGNAQGQQGIQPPGKNQKLRESRVLVYDAKLKEGAPYRTGIRDCVGLDEWKTARKGCKFDFEVIEPGAVFVTYLEQNYESDNERDICARLAALWKGRQIHIGHKTTRGLGAVECQSIRRKEFSMQKEKSIGQWLEFDMYDDAHWKANKWEQEEWEYKGSVGNILAQGCTLKLSLRQTGGISIRSYTTEVGDGKKKTVPDYNQVVYRRRDGADGGETEVPFIPGTTWAGAFRHHMERLNPGVTGDWFGKCEKPAGADKMVKKKSEVWFGESEIREARSKVLTRTAIDRFTGGVIRNALFTEKMWYGGTTDLEIGFPGYVPPAFLQAMAACIVDLHMGLLSIGGQTSIGRGMFEIDNLMVNGEEVPVPGKDEMEQQKIQELYTSVLEHINAKAEGDSHE